MNDKPNDILLLAGKLLTIIMQFACVIGAAVIAGLALLAIFDPGWITSTGYESSLGNAEPIIGLPIFFLLIAIFLGSGFLFFRKLKEIIDTVGEGNPFDLENASRLNTMAWLLLVMQFLVMPATLLGTFLAPWINAREDMSMTIEMGPDVEGILMVIILFILARVFKHGAAMREDLEGTV
ncbi:hypothetical protein EH31_11685 [Erythrobacter longus]|uniref:DUF2975 domain-containing protein n=1 Tax=Erythrobacter longus TaxID=1044 RepID=A0A074M535_ERYLO|nr:DUF2975 domain-containing protein [Erythrobacter longus]KEO89806.1 hypothetical protein EH31_11685 [Erythrobacter longus]